MTITNYLSYVSADETRYRCDHQGLVMINQKVENGAPSKFNISALVTTKTNNNRYSNALTIRRHYNMKGCIHAFLVTVPKCGFDADWYAVFLQIAANITSG